MSKEFLKDCVDEFFYLYGFGKKWNSSIVEEERLIKEKNEQIAKRIKQRKKLKWLNKKVF